MHKYIWIAIIFFVNIGFGQTGPEISGPSPDYTEIPLYQLHTKLNITPKCDLYVLLDQKNKKLWFIELIKRNLKSKDAIEIMDIIDNQEKYISNFGFVVDIDSLISKFTEFRYIEQKDSSEFTIVYATKHSKQKSSDVSLSKLYKFYSKDSSTFSWDNKTRSCLEEDN